MGEGKTLLDHAPYKIELDKLAHLQAEFEHLKSIHQRHKRLLHDEGLRVSSRAAKAAALLRGDAVKSPDDELLKRDFAQDQEQLEVVNVAIHQQRRIVTEVRGQATTLIRATYLAEHKRCAKAIAQALSELRRALTAERQFVEKLGMAIDSDCPVGSPLHPCCFVPGPYPAPEFLEFIERWFAEMQQADYL